MENFPSIDTVGRNKNMLLPDKDNRLRFIESNLEHLIFSARDRITDPNALSHLKGGLGARHYVLRHCRKYPERTFFTATKKPLSADIATEAALHLNRYYLNLRGALDNLAWVLQFELKTFPGITEVSGAKMRIHLFKEEFIEELKKKSLPHALPVLAMERWGQDLAKLRHPAAHRIPLYVPPGVFTSQEQIDEFQRLDALSGAPEEELGDRRRIEVMLEAQRVASFAPVFYVTSTNGIKIYSIPKQLLYDHRQYLHLVRKTLEAFK